MSAALPQPNRPRPSDGLGCDDAARASAVPRLREDAYPVAPGRLHPLDLERLADLIAEQLVEHFRDPSSGLVNADELARLLGVSRDYVYAHAVQLGARRLGTGPKGRLRFDPDEARAALNACTAGRKSSQAETPAAKPKPRRRRTTPMGTTTALLPIRGVSEAPERRAA